MYIFILITDKTLLDRISSYVTTMHMDILTIGCVGPNFQPGLDHLVSQYLVCAGSGWDPPVQLLVEPVLQSSSCSERSKFRFRYSQIFTKYQRVNN